MTDETLLLEVWREACQHIEIGELVDRIGPILFRTLPLQGLVLRRIDLAKSCVDTIAQAVRTRPIEHRTDAPPKQIERLLRWHSRGQIESGAAATLQGRLEGLVPAGLREEVMIGPLKAAHDPTAVMLLMAKPNYRIKKADHRYFEMLLEPFTVAFDNDRRLHELSTLREAAEAENRTLLSRLGRTDLQDAIVGQGSGLRLVMQRVDQVARSDVPVMIFGETGTGKEVIARAIHARSPRANGPVLRVNCGAIPSELIDSELFGHERGSFTGAVGTRKGWFERADGGTLFLDECGELPLAAQVRLLRVLQDGVVERVGGDREIHVDVRIVAATHRDLQAMITDGRFREDLWYRLSVFPIRLPPLRERIEDIAELAIHFSQRAAHRLGMPTLVPTQEDINLLIHYPWPGNVRELRAVMERAAILGDGKTLEVGKALGFVPAAPKQSAPIPEEKSVPQSDRNEIETLDAAMKAHIERALRQTRGRIDGPYGAAVLLDINPHTLRARMRKLGVDWRHFRAADTR
jgi:transcriptional regulator with GAF, ATPase, and Fis domain